MTATPLPDGRSKRLSRERLWNAVAGTTVGLGTVCALIAWGAWVWIYGALGAVLLAFLVAPHCGTPGLRRPVGIATGVVVAVVSTCGLTAALGWAGLTWVLSVAVTHPVLARRWARWLGPVRPGAVSGLGGEEAGRPGAQGARGELAEGPRGGLPEPRAVAELDDEALCQAWRRSFVHLGACRLTSRRLEIIHLRQVYLDELARRHPAAVERWLASGARAASNPMPFVARAPGEAQGEGEAPGDRHDDLSWPELG